MVSRLISVPSLSTLAALLAISVPFLSASSKTSVGSQSYDEISAGEPAFASPLTEPELVAGPNLTLVECEGTLCLGTGSRQYYYEIDPGPQGCDRFEFGVDVSNFVPSNVLFTGAGSAQHSFVAGQLRPHHSPWSQHGSIVSRNGLCSSFLTNTMRWDFSQTQFTPFVIAFNITSDTVIHDVTWNTNDGSKARWNQQVGNGNGLVHSPRILVIPPDNKPSIVTTCEEHVHEK